MVSSHLCDCELLQLIRMAAVSILLISRVKSQERSFQGKCSQIQKKKFKKRMSFSFQMNPVGSVEMSTCPAHGINVRSPTHTHTKHNQYLSIVVMINVTNNRLLQLLVYNL